MNDEPKKGPSFGRRPVCGILALIIICAGWAVGILWAINIFAHTSEAASFGGVIAGMGVVLLSTVIGSILGIIGLFRTEKPLWPAVVALTLGAIVWACLTGMTRR